MTEKFSLINILKEQEETHWYDTSNVKDQEATFVWDTKEYLTGIEIYSQLY